MFSNLVHAYVATMLPTLVTNGRNGVVVETLAHVCCHNVFKFNYVDTKLLHLLLFP